MPKKKKFIDKKNAVTFHLVHRSQQDPLAADETAPQHVLVPVQDNKVNKKQYEEEQKYGIFFDDDYNYLQHLKESNTTVEWVPVEPTSKQKDKSSAKLTLPSSVFASTVEEDVGLLNKAAPTGLRLDLDPDIVAAMDEDFDYKDPNNELEDNFMELANAECSGGDEYDSDDGEDRSDVSSNFEDEAMDEVASLDGGQLSFREEETKSRFTDYSMSSSVIRRNEQLTLLDDRFEHMYAKYDENEIGALDCDEIEGYVPETSDLLLQYAEEFDKYRKREQLDRDPAIAKAKLAQISDTDSESGDEKDEMVDFELKPKEKWDCASILSTYSNLYNHPKLIAEPKSNKIKLDRRGVPIIETNRLTAKALSKLDDSMNGTPGPGGAKSMAADSMLSTLSSLSIRPKGESPEERNERKRLVREYRRERRIERKVNADAFKEEAKRQVKIHINNQNNIQGNRIL